jgi:hypothetical protein
MEQATATVIPDPYKKNCKYKFCRKSFKAKRLNQDYCNFDCKKKANNGKARELRLLTKPVDDKLKLNRSLLERFYKQGKFIVISSELVLFGFDFTTHTGMVKDEKGQFTIPQYQNYTLRKLSENQYKIDQLWK